MRRWRGGRRRHRLGGGHARGRRHADRRHAGRLRHDAPADLQLTVGAVGTGASLLVPDASQPRLHHVSPGPGRFLQLRRGLAPGHLLHPPGHHLARRPPVHGRGRRLRPRGLQGPRDQLLGRLLARSHHRRGGGRFADRAVHLRRALHVPGDGRERLLSASRAHPGGGAVRRHAEPPDRARSDRKRPLPVRLLGLRPGVGPRGQSRFRPGTPAHQPGHLPHHPRQHQPGDRDPEREHRCLAELPGVLLSPVHERSGPGGLLVSRATLQLPGVQHPGPALLRQAGAPGAHAGDRPGSPRGGVALRSRVDRDPAHDLDDLGA